METVPPLSPSLRRVGRAWAGEVPRPLWVIFYIGRLPFQPLPGLPDRKRCATRYFSAPGNGFRRGAAEYARSAPGRAGGGEAGAATSTRSRRRAGLRHVGARRPRPLPETAARPPRCLSAHAPPSSPAPPLRAHSPRPSETRWHHVFTSRGEAGDESRTPARRY